MIGVKDIFYGKTAMLSMDTNTKTPCGLENPSKPQNRFLYQDDTLETVVFIKSKNRAGLATCVEKKTFYNYV